MVVRKNDYLNNFNYFLKENHPSTCDNKYRVLDSNGITNSNNQKNINETDINNSDKIDNQLNQNKSRIILAKIISF